MLLKNDGGSSGRGYFMSSRIEQLIDEIEEYIENCKYQALSNTKIIVNKEEID